jgi:hypothetical protein
MIPHGPLYMHMVAFGIGNTPHSLHTALYLGRDRHEFIPGNGKEVAIGLPNTSVCSKRKFDV